MRDDNDKDDNDKDDNDNNDDDDDDGREFWRLKNEELNFSD